MAKNNCQLQLQWEENYPYKNMDEAMQEIDALRKQIDLLTKENTDYAIEVAQLKSENNRLKKFEDDVVAFEERVKRFDQYVVFNDKAPDVSEYKQFYESIDPENAERLYPVDKRSRHHRRVQIHRPAPLGAGDEQRKTRCRRNCAERNNLFLKQNTESD